VGRRSLLCDECLDHGRAVAQDVAHRGARSHEHPGDGKVSSAVSTAGDVAAQLSQRCVVGTPRARPLIRGGMPVPADYQLIRPDCVDHRQVVERATPRVCPPPQVTTSHGSAYSVAAASPPPLRLRSYRRRRPATPLRRARPRPPRSATGSSVSGAVRTSIQPCRTTVRPAMAAITPISLQDMAASANLRVCHRRSPCLGTGRQPRCLRRGCWSRCCWR
jgi:hypothetical protein